MILTFSQKLEAELRRAEDTLLHAARTLPLDDLRYKAGFIDGLRAALQAYQNLDKEITDGKISRS